MTIFDLPKEIIKCICNNLDIFDIINFGSSCQYFYNLIDINITFPYLVITKCLRCRTFVYDTVFEFVPYKMINLKQFYTIYDQMKKDLVGHTTFEIHAVLPGVEISYPSDNIIIDIDKRYTRQGDGFVDTEGTFDEMYYFNVYQKVDANTSISDDDWESSEEISDDEANSAEEISDDEENSSEKSIFNEYSTQNQLDNKILREIIRRCLKITNRIMKKIKPEDNISI